MILIMNCTKEQLWIRFEWNFFVCTFLLSKELVEYICLITSLPPERHSNQAFTFFKIDPLFFSISQKFLLWEFYEKYKKEIRGVLVLMKKTRNTYSTFLDLSKFMKMKNGGIFTKPFEAR